MAEWVDLEEIDTYEDAVQVVLEGIGMRVDPRKVLWCNYPALWHDKNEFEERIKKETKKMEKELGHELSPTRLWYVGVPKFKLLRRGVPYLSCEIDLYYAACDTSNEYWSWYGKILPKADSFEVPLSLIESLLSVLSRGEMETDKATVLERGCGYSIYDYLEREWRIPDAFLGFLWALREKGKDFNGLLDPYSCLLMERFAKELPPPDVPKLTSGDDYQAIVTWLKEKMGYPKTKAEEAARRSIEKLPQGAIEEKIKYALNYLSG